MKGTLALAWAVFGLDFIAAERVFGRFHPVAFVGWLIEAQTRAFSPWIEKGPWARYCLGILLVFFTLAVSAVPLWGLLALAGWASPTLEIVLWVLIGYASVCLRGLLDEGYRVLCALSSGELKEARGLLRALVGRDTQRLDAQGVARATLESLAENLGDAFIAPMLYLAVGGPVLAWVYRVVNTLDSMVGYKHGPFREFGWFAARLDDALNWVPARISAVLIGLTGLMGMGSIKRAMAAVLRDASKHESPNAGYPEAAMAGLLGVRLGGERAHPGKPGAHAMFWAGGREPLPKDVLDGIVAGFLAALLGMGFLSLVCAVL